MRGHLRRMVACTASAVLLAALSVGTGCAALDYDRRIEFEEAQKRFTQYVRWGKIAKASDYVAVDIREEFLALAPDLTELRFTDYEVLELDLDDDLEHARVEVRYAGYRLSSPVERTVDVTQEWNRDEESGLWQVRMELAPIREVLLGVRP